MTVRQLLVAVSLYLQMLFPASAHADFLSDRCYVDTRGDLDPPISRLFIGIDETNRCLGGKLSICEEKTGSVKSIDDIEVVGEGEVIVRIYGEKNLYLGTGENNQSIGPEWREFRVINGKIVEEYSYVQLLEHGYSWNARPFVELPNRNYSCESYGKCGAHLCFGVEPIEPIPELPTPPEIVKKYSPQEIGNRFFELVFFESCSRLSERSRIKTEPVYKRWKNEAHELVDMLESSPEFVAYKKLSEDRKNEVSTKDVQRAEEDCEEYRSAIVEHLDGPDSRLASPQKTWDLFIDALKTGNIDLALVCLTGNAKKKFLSAFGNSDISSLKKFGESFVQFELTGEYGDFQEAVTSRSNGRAGFMYFVETAGNWKISEM